MSAVRSRFHRWWAPWGLLLGLALAVVGYLGPWVAHPTAALTLTGPDLGEFVKFLPEGVPSGRQLFYAPAVAVVVAVALVARRYPWLVRAPLVLLAVPVSAQVLPPAWSVPVLQTPEFLAQTVALGVCWLLLLGHGWLGRLPRRWAGVGVALASLAAGASAGWQYLRVRPAIGAVYSASGALQPVGWGWFVCLGGLALLASSGLVLGLRGEVAAP